MITPISLFNIPKNLPFNGKINNFQTSAKSAPDVFSPSSCENDKQTLFENELKNLDGIHCARCKQKMLSAEKYENLKLRISQVQNGHELLGIIEENKDYLTNSTSLILKDLNYTNNKYPDADINKVIKKIHNHAPLYYFNALETNVNLLELVSDKLDMSDNDRKHYKRTAKELKFLLDNKSFEYGQFKTIMNGTLKETDYPKKRKLFEKIMRQQGRAYKYYKSINSQDLVSKETPKALENLCWALFGRSRSKISDISQKESYSDVNKILICTDCDHKTRNHSSYFKMTDDNIMLKNSFTQYIQDISRAINKNELNVENNYFNRLIKHAIINSENKIEFNKNDIEFIRYKKNIKEMPFEHVEGLPCPKCSGIMMTYEQMEKAKQNIAESDSIKDLNNILKSNKKYLPTLTKTLAEKFEDIYIRDPYITDVLMKNKMQAFVKNLTQQKYRNFISVINKKIKDDSTDSNDRKLLQELKINLKKFDKSGFLVTGELHKILENSGLIDGNNKFGLEALYDDMAITIEVIQAPVFQSKEFSKNNNWSKKFADRLIRNAIMTKDHMIARNYGGADDLDNTMALHKECNRLKGKKVFDDWFNEEPKTEEYTADYLREIKKLSAQGKIKNCETYSKDISNQIFKLTGKTGLKNEFCKKDSH